MITFQNTSKFKVKDLRKKKLWLNSISNNEGKKIESLSFLFVDDEEMLKYNKKYLQHESYTDIITFDYCEKNRVNGDLFISIDRVKDNAKSFNSSIENELHRVMIHGILHLCGYKDKTPEDQNVMSAKEDFYLNLRDF